jgi:hypothetical protein
MVDSRGHLARVVLYTSQSAAMAGVGFFRRAVLVEDLVGGGTSTVSTL